MLDLSPFSALTFDCYGTLIDWETGILQAVRPVLSVRGVRAPDADILTRFARLEREIESGDYLPYREVLRTVMRRLGDSFGFTPEERELDRLPESIKRWPAFPDTVPTLQSLAARFRLAIVSNIDDDLFEYTRPKLGVQFDRVVTAQLCRSYKPHPRHFKVALALLDLPPQQVLHVAESRYHDIAPARKLGLTTVWVNRHASRPGPSASGDAAAEPDAQVPDLAALAALIR
jgi:2-haloacid dehalogenase